jgi:hypothetical protein
MNKVSSPMFHFYKIKRKMMPRPQKLRRVTIRTSLQHVLAMNKQQFTALGGCRKYHIL